MHLPDRRLAPAVVLAGCYVAIGAVIALGSAGSALVVAAVVALLGFAATVSEPELLGPLPVVLTLSAPWQRLETFSDRMHLYPVFWVAVLVTVICASRRGLRFLALDGVIVASSFHLVWVLLRRAYGYGDTQAMLRWLALWVLGLMIYLLVRSPTVSSRAMHWSWLVAAGLGLYSSVEWLFKRNWIFGGLVPVAVEKTFLSADGYRSQASLGHPLVLADVLGVLLLVGLTNEMLSERLRPLRIAGLGAGLLGMVFSGGRGALVMLLVCTIAAVAFQKMRFNVRLRRTMLIVLAVSVILAVAAPVIESRFRGVHESESFQQRVRSIVVAASVVSQSPIFGSQAATPQEELASKGLAVVIPESEYASKAISTGIPGLLGILAVPIAGLLVSWKRGGGWRGLPIALYSLGIIGTHNFFDWWGGVVLYFGATALVSATGDSCMAAVDA